MCVRVCVSQSSHSLKDSDWYRYFIKKRTQPLNSTHNDMYTRTDGSPGKCTHTHTHTQKLAHTHWLYSSATHNTHTLTPTLLLHSSGTYKSHKLTPTLLLHSSGTYKSHKLTHTLLLHSSGTHNFSEAGTCTWFTVVSVLLLHLLQQIDLFHGCLSLPLQFI